MPSTDRDDNIFLCDRDVGDQFDSFLVVQSRELRTTRAGQPFLALKLGDRSGDLPANIWDDAERWYAELYEGCVVKVRGMIELYKEKPQVRIILIRSATDDDQVDPADFLPVSDSDPQDNLDQIKEITDTISNDHLKTLLTSFLDDDDFTTGFMKAPGGKKWHHNRIGGLIEHTLSVCRLCVTLAEMYPEIDRDLLVTGAILHDIGKIEEFCYDTFFDYTSRGRLVGHISLGAQWAVQRASQIEGFPDDLLDQVQHLILSHQGEFDTPVLPKTREAFLLNHADDIDAKMDAFRRIRKKMPEGERWIWVNLLDRFIDLPP